MAALGFAALPSKELFATSKQTVSHHIVNILKEGELPMESVVKQYLTTAADGHFGFVEYFN